MTVKDFQVFPTNEQIRTSPDAIQVGWVNEPWRAGKVSDSVWQIGEFFQIERNDKWKGPIAPTLRIGHPAYESLEKLQAYLDYRSPAGKFIPLA